MESESQSLFLNKKWLVIAEIVTALSSRLCVLIGRYLNAKVFCFSAVSTYIHEAFIASRTMVIRGRSKRPTCKCNPLALFYRRGIWRLCDNHSLNGPNKEKLNEKIV